MQNQFSLYHLQFAKGDRTATKPCVVEGTETPFGIEPCELESGDRTQQGGARR